MTSPSQAPKADAPVFEERLIQNLQPIRGFAVATALFHFFSLGLAESVLGAHSSKIADLASRHSLELGRLEALLYFLQAEDFLRIDGDCVEPLERLSTVREAWPWYEMLIGGYGRTFLEIGEGLRVGSPSLSRNGTLVGSGSCKISHYDAIPLTKHLLKQMPAVPRKVIDIGCGNALYLEELCSLHSDLLAVGVEPDAAGHAQSLERIVAGALSSRIRLYNASGQDFVAGTDERDADALIVAFVLQEILGQDRRSGVIGFLQNVMERFPAAHLIVVEVDDQSRNNAVMRHGLAQAYYNPYFLVHPFTQQALASLADWREMFAEAGFKIVAEATTDPDVDSTGFEIGFLLARA